MKYLAHNEENRMKTSVPGPEVKKLGMITIFGAHPVTPLQRHDPWSGMYAS